MAPGAPHHTKRACPEIQTQLRETIAPAARTAMPDLQLGLWIDAKRRERAYKRQDKKTRWSQPAQAISDEIIPRTPLPSNTGARRA
jgi:hypothetical protein